MERERFRSGVASDFGQAGSSALPAAHNTSQSTTTHRRSVSLPLQQQQQHLQQQIQNSAPQNPMNIGISLNDDHVPEALDILTSSHALSPVRSPVRSQKNRSMESEAESPLPKGLDAIGLKTTTGEGSASRRRQCHSSLWMDSSARSLPLGSAGYQSIVDNHTSTHPRKAVARESLHNPPRTTVPKRQQLAEAVSQRPNAVDFSLHGGSDGHGKSRSHNSFKQWRATT